ncbi:MAG: hypothetical protein AB7E69_10165 [Sphingomonadales bacterium]
MNIPALSDLRGLWRRSLILWPDGRRDTTTSVHWLQGPSLFVDFRCPAWRPDMTWARCLGDMGWHELGWLARQEGFAGRLDFDGHAHEWLRDMDFQPASAVPDAGRLRLVGDMMIEEGIASRYVEHWHREGEAAPCAALRLKERRGDAVAIVVRVGDAFMYARGRTARLPAGETLSHCLARCRSIGEARALLDFEISFGIASPPLWTITRSSLPFREDHPFQLRSVHGSKRLRSPDVTTEGIPRFREWTILEAEGDMDAIVALAAGAQAARRT